MGTKRFWMSCTALIAVTLVMTGGMAFAGDGVATSAAAGAPPAGDLPPLRTERRVEPAATPVVVQPVGYTPAATQPVVARPASQLYDDGLRPGMVLRTWRVPDTQPGVVVSRGTYVQPGMPGPDDGDFADFPPCPPRPPTDAPRPAAPVTTYDAPPTGAMTGGWPEDEPPPPPPAEVEIIEEEPAPLEVIEPPAPAPEERPQLRRAPAGPALPNLGGVCDPDCAQARDACCWPVDPCGKRYGRFELSVEAMFSIPNSPEGFLGETIFGATDQFDWESLDYEFEFGARGTARYAVSPGKWLEGRFTWYGDKWDDTAGATLGRFGFAPGPGGVGGASGAAPGILSSEAELWSGEFNFVGEFECSGCWRWDLILGFRTFQFDENSSVNFPNGVLVGAGPAFVNSSVENHFLGGQFGIGAHWDINPKFTLNFSLKALIGDLSRKADVTDTSIFVGGPHAARSTKTEIVFGTDIEIGFRWRFTRCIALTGGYNMFFVDNVLRAYDAMDFGQSVSGAVQARQQVDQLIVHSLFAGLNINL